MQTSSKVLNSEFSRVAILGSTGSIGQNTLSVIADNQQQFAVHALSANRDIETLAQQIKDYRPSYAVIADESLSVQASVLQADCREWGLDTEILLGPDSLQSVAEDEAVDTVVAGIVGAAGLASTLAAAKAGKRILLANKEAIVMGGQLFTQTLRENNASVLPVDSEHNAIFQCLPEGIATAVVAGAERRAADNCRLEASGISKVLLTGSGGPFRALPLEKFSTVTPEQACLHPNWSMGKKISVDSATMMNKGLELIEACWLFGCDDARIEIVIHPQSVVHSMVQYSDGSVVAQLGQPDMRTPIAHALAWPGRIANSVEPLDWSSMQNLSFEQPDHQRFPALRIAREVARANDYSAIIMNAANEVLVDSFLEGGIRFDQIWQGVDTVLAQNHAFREPHSLQEIMAIDHETRCLTAGLIQRW